jgi:uncharacterized membrane protein HdeD (DUF308 family)
MDKLNEFLWRLTSRKFLLAILGVITVFWGGLSPEQTTAITALIIAFTAAEGVADYKAR